MTLPRIDLRPGVTEPIVLLLSRREIEAGDVAGAVERLHNAFNTAEAIWQARGQLALVVDGYNDDPRELVDIAEVRKFLRALDAKWPYWAFFFNTLDASIPLYLSCLCGDFYPGGGLVELDHSKLGRTLVSGFAAMNALFDANGFPENELETMSQGVIEALEQAGLLPES